MERGTESLRTVLCNTPKDGEHHGHVDGRWSMVGPYVHTYPYLTVLPTDPECPRNNQLSDF